MALLEFALDYNNICYWHQCVTHVPPIFVIAETLQSVHFVQVEPEQAGQRLDNFLVLHMRGVPRAHINKVIRKGEVRVNKGRVKNIYRLQVGDVVRVPPVRVAPKQDAQSPPKAVLRRLEDRLLFEDSRMMVVNKPHGLAVHGGSGLNYGLIEGIRAIRPENEFLELVHRLDRDTSGCLLIAKKRSSLKFFHDLFRSNQIRKTYTALLYGCIHRDQVKVTAPLQKNILQSGERLVRVHPDGKPSETRFVPEQRFQSATLVKAYPKSGRTHQIRVHAQSIRHAIVGDERYSPPELRKAFRQQGFKRLFLHASALEYVDQQTGQRVRFEAPLDRELQQSLELLD